MGLYQLHDDDDNDDGDYDDDDNDSDQNWMHSKQQSKLDFLLVKSSNSRPLIGRENHQKNI